MNKFKFLNKINIIIIFLILIIVTISIFLYKKIDIGINSEKLIKDNFQQAFLYRVTGNCENFKKYLYFNENLYINCLNEKNNKTKPIYKYKLLTITIDENKIAYLQVLLNREIVNTKDYIVNYKMANIFNEWYFIDDNFIYALKLFNGYKISQKALDFEVNKIKNSSELTTDERNKIQEIFQELVNQYNQ